MGKALWAWFAAVFLAIFIWPALSGAGERTADMADVSALLRGIEWLGHDTFRIADETVIYTDPFQLKAGGPKAELILITHEHRDHCSPEDVAKILTEKTVIVAPPDCAAKLGVPVRTVRPGDSLTVGNVGIRTVRAYNLNKKFHPRGSEWVGYVFTLAGRSIYLAGDTDRIPEMKDIRADVALLPVSGTYVMTAEEAAEAALDIKPKVAVPMHYASIVGSEDDARRFAAILKGKVEVHVFDLP